MLGTTLLVVQHVAPLSPSWPYTVLGLPSSFYDHTTACRAPGNIRLRDLGREGQTSLTPVSGLSYL